MKSFETTVQNVIQQVGFMPFTATQNQTTFSAEKVQVAHMHSWQNLKKGVLIILWQLSSSNLTAKGTSFHVSDGNGKSDFLFLDNQNVFFLLLLF